MPCQILFFLEKIRQNINLLSAEYAHRLVKVKLYVIQIDSIEFTFGHDQKMHFK